MSHRTRSVPDPDSIAFKAGEAVGGIAQDNPIIGGLGALISSMGNVEEKIEHEETQRRTEFKVQNSKFGVGIPEGYGTVRIGGNIIFASIILETQRIKKIGWKAIPTSTDILIFSIPGVDYEPIELTIWEYWLSMDVAICKGPATAVTRIWTDNYKIWDIRNNKIRNEAAQLMETGHAGRDLGYGEIPNTVTTIWLGDGQNDRDQANEQHIDAEDLPRYNDIVHIYFDWLLLNRTSFQIPLVTAEVSFEAVDGSIVHADTDDIVPFDISSQVTPSFRNPFLRNRSIDEYYTVANGAQFIYGQIRIDAHVWMKWDPYLSFPLFVRPVEYGHTATSVPGDIAQLDDLGVTIVTSTVARSPDFNQRIFHIAFSIDPDNGLDIFDLFDKQIITQTAEDPDGLISLFDFAPPTSTGIIDTKQEAKDANLLLYYQTNFSARGEMPGLADPWVSALLSPYTNTIPLGGNFTDFSLYLLADQVFETSTYKFNQGSSISFDTPSIPKFQNGLLVRDTFIRMWEPATSIGQYAGKKFDGNDLIKNGGLWDPAEAARIEDDGFTHSFDPTAITEAELAFIPTAGTIEIALNDNPTNTLFPPVNITTSTLFSPTALHRLRGVDAPLLGRTYVSDFSGGGFWEPFSHEEFKHKGFPGGTPPVVGSNHYRYLADGRHLFNSSLDEATCAYGGTFAGNNWLVKFDHLEYRKTRVLGSFPSGSILDWVYDDAESAEHTADPVLGVPNIAHPVVDLTQSAQIKQGEFQYRYVTWDKARAAREGTSIVSNVNSRYWSPSRMAFYGPELFISGASEPHSMTSVSFNYLPVTHSTFETGIGDFWRQTDIRATHVRKLVWEIIDTEINKTVLKTADNDYTDIITLDIWGTFVSSQNKIRDVIEPLTNSLFFAPVESDGKIKWVKKGAASIVTIPESELLLKDHIFMSEESVLDRAKTYEFIYADYNREHQQGTQTHEYMVTKAFQDKKLVVPITYDENEAAKIADILHKQDWEKSESYEFSLPRKYVYLDPTDVITITLDSGTDKVMYIDSITYEAGEVQIKAYRMDPINDTYTSAKTGEIGFYEAAPFATMGRTQIVAFETSHPLFGMSPTTGTIFVTAFQRNNIRNPIRIRAHIGDGKETLSQSTNPRKWIMQAVTFNWQGHFSETLIQPEGTPAYGYWDFDSEITAVLLSGIAPVSITEEAVYNGQNLCFVQPGEVLSFQNVEFVADGVYKLTKIFRKRRHTEITPMDIESGAKMVQIYSNMPAYTYEEGSIGETMHFEAESLTDSAVSNRSLSGLGLRPLPPGYIEGNDVGGNLVLTWDRRYRADGALRPFADIPVGDIIEYKIVTTDEYGGQLSSQTTTSQTDTISGGGETEFIVTLFQKNSLGYGPGTTRHFNLTHHKTLYFEDYTGISAGTLPSFMEYTWFRDATDTALVEDTSQGRVLELTYNKTTNPPVIGRPIKPINFTHFNEFEKTKDFEFKTSFYFQDTSPVSGERFGIVFKARPDPGEPTEPSPYNDEATWTYVWVTVPNQVSAASQINLTLKSKIRTFSYHRQNKDVIIRNESMLSGNLGSLIVPKEWYTMKLSVWDNVIRVKVYREGRPEPKEWDLVHRVPYFRNNRYGMGVAGRLGFGYNSENYPVWVRDTSIGLNGVPV